MNPFDKLRIDFLKSIETRRDLRNIVHRIASELTENIRRDVASTTIELGAVKMAVFEHLLRENGKDALINLLQELAKDFPFHIDVDDGDSISLSDRLAQYEQECADLSIKRRDLGCTLDENFVGRTDDLAAIENLLFQTTNKISGVCIYGTSGIGKTTISEQLCISHRADLCFVNLRDVQKTEDVVMRLYGRLGLQWNTAILEDYIGNIVHELQTYEKNQDTVIILDSVEVLIDANRDRIEAEKFMNLLSAISTVEQQKIKVILTSIINPWTQENMYAYFKSLETSFPTYNLKSLKLEDCVKLLKMITPKYKDILHGNVGATIVQKCCYNSLAIRAVGSYLNTSAVDPAKIHQYAERLVASESGKSCLGSVLEKLDDTKLELLMQLSVVNSDFNIDVAMAVTGKEHRSLMYIELDELFGRSLLELKSSTPANANLHDTESYGQLYSMHILVKTCLNSMINSKKSSRNEIFEKYREIKDSSKQRLIEYGRKLFLKLGKAACSNALRVAQKLADEKHYLMEYINNAKTIQNTHIPHLSNGKEFRQQSYAHMLMDWLMAPEHRADYFLHMAKVAEKNKNPLTCCMMLLWYAEQYFEGWLFDPDIVKSVSNTVKKKLKSLEKGLKAKGSTVNKSKSLSIQLCKAFYLYVYGRYLDRIGELNDGISNVKRALDIHKKSIQYDVIIARDLNLLGHLYLKNNNPKKAVSYHEKACSVMQKVAAQNDKVDLHFDNPNYYMNTGSAFLVLGNHHYYDSLKCESDEDRTKMISKMNDCYRKAVKSFDHALHHCTKLGMESTLVYGRILKNKACVLAEMEKPEEALETLNDCLPLFNDLSGGEQRMQFFYMRGTIYKDLAAKALKEENSEANEENMTKAEEDFKKSTSLLLSEGHFRPRDQFIPKLQRDYVIVLKMRGKTEEAEQVYRQLQSLIDHGSIQATEHQTLVVEESKMERKTARKRKLSVQKDGSTSKRPKLTRSTSIVKEEETYEPEPLIPANTDLPSEETEETDASQRPPFFSRVRNWIRRSFSRDSSMDDDEPIPGPSSQLDIITETAELSNKSEDSKPETVEELCDISVSAVSSKQSTSVSDESSILNDIGKTPENTDESSSSSSGYSGVQSPVMDLDERNNVAISEWRNHKENTMQWLREIDCESSAGSEDSFKTATGAHREDK